MKSGNVLFNLEMRMKTNILVPTRALPRSHQNFPSQLSLSLARFWFSSSHRRFFQLATLEGLKKPVRLPQFLPLPATGDEPKPVSLCLYVTRFRFRFEVVFFLGLLHTVVWILHKFWFSSKKIQNLWSILCNFAVRVCFQFVFLFPSISLRSS